MAFLILGAVTVLSSPRAFSGRRLLAVVVAYAAVLEAGQFFIPGRVASLLDLAASSAGALVGVTFALSVRRLSALSPATWRAASRPLADVPGRVRPANKSLLQSSGYRVLERRSRRWRWRARLNDWLVIAGSCDLISRVCLRALVTLISERRRAAAIVAGECK